jgi:hypothetical protein
MYFSYFLACSFLQIKKDLQNQQTYESPEDAKTPKFIQKILKEEYGQ